MSKKEVVNDGEDLHKKKNIQKPIITSYISDDVVLRGQSDHVSSCCSSDCDTDRTSK